VQPPTRAPVQLAAQLFLCLLHCLHGSRISYKGYTGFGRGMKLLMAPDIHSLRRGLSMSRAQGQTEADTLTPEAAVSITACHTRTEAGGS
jgi:hypothetical protein